MTPYELSIRDLLKAQLNLARAMNKPNVTETEIANLEEKVSLRKAISDLLEVNNDTTQFR